MLQGDTRCVYVYNNKMCICLQNLLDVNVHKLPDFASVMHDIVKYNFDHFTPP